MLYFPLTRANVSGEFAVDPSNLVTSEGQALVSQLVNGVVAVKPSTGAANTEQFMGIAVSQQMTITSMTKVEDIVQPSSNTVTLDFTPSSGTLSVYDQTAGAVIASGAGGWTLSGNVVTLQAGTAGHSLTFYYRYAPTSLQSEQIQGDIYPGGPAGNVVNQVGIMRNGVVYTSEYDTTVNWNVALPVVSLGANGRFTIGGSGAVLNGARVIAVPTSTSAFLGLLLTL
jgi:hypothetical protein